MGATTPEDEQSLESRGTARESRQPSSDVLYSFLQAAATDAFRLSPPAADAAANTAVPGTNTYTGNMPRSILREGSLRENIAEVRRKQARRLSDYNAMVEIARARTDDDEATASNVSEEPESPPCPMPTGSAALCTNDTISRDRLLMILREASSVNSRRPNDTSKYHKPSKKRSALDRERAVRPGASNLSKAVSAVHCEQAARLDEYRRMCHVAMLRSADDFGVSDNSKEGVGSKVFASEHQSMNREGQGLRTEVAAVRQEIAGRVNGHKRIRTVAKSTSAAGPVDRSINELITFARSALCRESAVPPSSNTRKVIASEHKSMYRAGQGLSAEVVAVRQEIAGRLDEHKRMCAIAKSTPADGPADSKNELILSSARSAVSQAFAVPRPCNPAAGQNSLFRTSAKEELRQELEARLKEHQSMSRVAMSRSEDLSAISDKQEKSVEEESTSSETKMIHPSTNITARSKLATPKTPDQPMPFTVKPSHTPHTGTHFGMTAPRFTEEEEAKEKAALTAEEKAEAQASIEGRKLPPTAPVSEYDSLDELELELQKIPDEDKAEYVEATAKCPEIAKDEALLLQFLRCVSVRFDAKAAARRVVAYWKRRVELFGADKAFLPLSIATSLSDDGEALATGSYRILPDADDSGRLVIVYSVRHQMPDRYPRESMLRVFWYMVHATLENRSPNANGYVILLNPVGPNEVFDRKLCKFMIDLDRECLPNQITAWHHLLSTPMLPIYAPFWKHQLGPRIRRVLTVHGSEIEENIQLLARCGLSPDRLMTDLGGEVEIDYEKWVKDRRNRGI